MNSINVGLIGALIDNENMGCVALTYSLIGLIEELSKDQDWQCIYYIFGTIASEKKISLTSERLKVPVNRIRSVDITPLYRTRRFLHHFREGVQTLYHIQKCELFIDVTGGDSFTDIYGQYVFDAGTNVKLLIEKLHKPLLLGPQTYGPFTCEKNIIKAKQVIERATVVISRDQKSIDYISRFAEKKIYLATDLAFSLPFHKEKCDSGQKIKVGINVSGLLVADKTESTKLTLQLKADYNSYICGVINYLLEQNKYEIYIIPHVGTDGGNFLITKYGTGLTYIEPFKDPISAKSFISGMDIFIGARMHSTIAAFSSEVATIPTAYSRKFSGLFESLNYPYIIDLLNQDTENCLRSTIQYIDDYKHLKEYVVIGNQIAYTKSKETRKLLKREMDIIINRKFK